MSNAGDGLLDAEAQREDTPDVQPRPLRDRRRPRRRELEAQRALESLRLARAELSNQLEATTHEHRRTVIRQALAEIDRRIARATPTGADDISS